MAIKFNEVTWYSKLGAVILFILVVPVLTFIIGREYQKTVEVVGDAGSRMHVAPQRINTMLSTFVDPLNGTYTLDGQEITLVNGKSEQQIAPGSASKISTRIFGQPIVGDLNADGRKDTIFFVSQETGGTGIFYFVVAAVGQGGKYSGTPGIFLGDRIAAQNITIRNGTAAVNYAVRKDNEPLAAMPSVGVTKYVQIREGKLVETSNPDDQDIPAVLISHDSGAGNVVGYFAHGSFYWYVPDWITENWKSQDHTDGDGMTFSPRVPVLGQPFSDIVIAVHPTTETYNAVFLYDQERTSSQGKLITNEVMLNKHIEGGTTIKMETNTRIYHVQREVGNAIYDRYYIDGFGGRTANIFFSAPTQTFPLFEAKIRGLVEGIGMGGEPQG